MTRIHRPSDEGESSRKDDSTYVYMRAEDRSIWLKVTYYLEKYKIIVWFVFWAMTAFGFDFKWPGKTIDEVKLKIDTLQVERKVEMRIQQKRLDSLNNIMSVLIRLRCAELAGKPETRRLAGLDCSKVLGEGK